MTFLRNIKPHDLDYLMEKALTNPLQVIHYAANWDNLAFGELQRLYPAGLYAAIAVGLSKRMDIDGIGEEEFNTLGVLRKEYEKRANYDPSRAPRGSAGPAADGSRFYSTSGSNVNAGSPNSTAPGKNTAAPGTAGVVAEKKDDPDSGSDPVN